MDFGDARTVPGYIEDTLGRIEEFVRPIAEAGVVPLGIGGDHSVTLAELRAIASVHGPLGLLQFDSHTDLWDEYNGRPYSHGTMFRRAIEEGVVDPARMIQVGMRGPLYGVEDERIPEELGVEMIPWHELAGWTPAELAERARERLAGRPAFLTFDVDFVDPAYCPGRGRRRSAVRPRSRRSSCCARAQSCRSSASTSSRWRRPMTGPARSRRCSPRTRCSRCCRSSRAPAARRTRCDAQPAAAAPRRRRRRSARGSGA